MSAPQLSLPSTMERDCMLEVRLISPPHLISPTVAKLYAVRPDAYVVVVQTSECYVDKKVSSLVE